jgi:hypothetical protein
MHTLAHSRWHREGERLELSVRRMFATAGSLVITVLTVLILYFGVFLARTR